MKMTAQDLTRLGIADEIVKEPVGGAHRSHEEAIRALSGAIGRALKSLDGLDAASLRKERREKFLAMGVL
jgi:acetyl-CoA carboxylase carboxyl transferase subunit alpha